MDRLIAEGGSCAIPAAGEGGGAPALPQLENDLNEFLGAFVALDFGGSSVMPKFGADMGSYEVTMFHAARPPLM